MKRINDILIKIYINRRPIGFIVGGIMTILGYHDLAELVMSETAHV